MGTRTAWTAVTRTATRADLQSGGVTEPAWPAPRAENAVYRHKRLIGDRLQTKRPEAQMREAMIAVRVLNRMTELGVPEWVVAV